MCVKSKENQSILIIWIFLWVKKTILIYGFRLKLKLSYKYICARTKLEVYNRPWEEGWWGDYPLWICILGNDCNMYDVYNSKLFSLYHFITKINVLTNFISKKIFSRHKIRMCDAREKFAEKVNCRRTYVSVVHERI